MPHLARDEQPRPAKHEPLGAGGLALQSEEGARRCGLRLPLEPLLHHRTAEQQDRRRLILLGLEGVTAPPARRKGRGDAQRARGAGGLHHRLQRLQRAQPGHAVGSRRVDPLYHRQAERSLAHTLTAARRHGRPLPEGLQHRLRRGARAGLLERTVRGEARRGEAGEAVVPPHALLSPGRAGEGEHRRQAKAGGGDSDGARQLKRRLGAEPEPPPAAATLPREADALVALPRPRDAEALLPPAKDEGHLAAASRRKGCREAEDWRAVQQHGCRVEYEDRRQRREREHVKLWLL